MFEEIRFLASDSEADEALSLSLLSASSSIHDLALAARANAHPKLQSALLAKRALNPSETEECQILNCWVAFNLLDKRSFDNILFALRETNPARFEVRVLTLLGWLWRNDIAAIASCPSDIWSGEDHSLLLQLCKADFYLKAEDLRNAEIILRGLPDDLCPEAVMLQVFFFRSRVVIKMGSNFCCRNCIGVLAILDTIVNC